VLNWMNQDQWDQQTTNRELCERILRAEGDKLASLPIKSSGMPLDGVAGVRTLKELLEAGAADEIHATNGETQIREQLCFSTICSSFIFVFVHLLSFVTVMAWFKMELTLVTDVKVMLAIDNYNCLYNPSSYYDMDSTRYRPVPLVTTQLTIPNLFLRPEKQVSQCGFFCFSLCNVCFRF
jgi:hypothetical protein